MSETLKESQDDQTPNEQGVGSPTLGYKTHPAWIKVTEKLPEEGQFVLIAILHRPCNCPWHYSKTEALYKNERWLDGDHSCITPEYWMPWPEDPFLDDFGGERVL